MKRQKGRGVGGDAKSQWWKSLDLASSKVAYFQRCRDSLKKKKHKKKNLVSVNE